MTSTVNENKKYLGVWLDKGFYDALSAMAKSNDRPLSNEVRRALKDRLEEHDAKTQQ